MKPTSPADIRKLYNEDADAIGVLRFATAMTEKLNIKRSEGASGWNLPRECSMERLCKLLRDHMEKGDPVDIGNIAMMIWNRQHPKG